MNSDMDLLGYLKIIFFGSKFISYTRSSRILECNPFKSISVAEAAKFKLSLTDRHGAQD